MAAKYFRLVCFVMDICSELLREIFISLAQNDPGTSYTTIDAYLSHRHRDVWKLRMMKQIRNDQYDLMYPRHGAADVKQWDVSLLLTLIMELFAAKHQPLVKIGLNEIGRIWNQLQHLPSASSMSDEDFDSHWNDLDTACMNLSNRFCNATYKNELRKKIDNAKTSHLPDPGDTLRLRNEELIRQMNDISDTISVMKNKLEVESNTRERKSARRKMTEEKQGTVGDDRKRFKTVDGILARLRANFERTMKELSDSFSSPVKENDIRTKLRDNHYVVITGSFNCRYCDTALAAIKGMDYNYNRCVEMRNSLDWRHIDPKDVDFVLCKDPFGRFSYDEKKAKRMADIFNSMMQSTKGDAAKHLDILIVTDFQILTECKTNHDHDILGSVVKLFDDTSETQPHDLTLELKHPNTRSTCLPAINNTEVMTSNFLKQYKVYSSQVDKDVLKEARIKFKAKKVIVVTGPRKSGKTSVAVALASSYEPSQCKLLTDPNDFKTIDYQNTCLVIIDEFAGKYRYEESDVYRWYTMFDHLYSAILAGQMNAVITCERNKFEKCFNEICEHPILAHRVVIPERTNVTKQEVVHQPTKLEVMNTDTSSHSDDSYNDKNGNARDGHSKRKIDNKTDTDGRGSGMRIDTDAWTHCFNQNDFERHAVELLGEGIIPDGALLKQICIKYNRRSNIVRTICQSICHFLKQLSCQIVHVWAAFRYEKSLIYDENDIGFVLMITEPVKIITGFTTYPRHLHQISEENDRENHCITLKENQSKLENAKMKDLTLCLKSNGRQLMEKHTKLTRVTLSWIRSRGFGTKDHSMQNIPCIALYVQIKGLVPINEEPFEELVDGYPVDVREGVFTLFGSPTDLHQNIKMGCALDSGYGTKQGTVGPFFRFETDPYTYFLTSAVVLLDPEQMKKLIKDECVHYGDCGSDAYQPPESLSVTQNRRHILGRTEFAVYKKGSENKPGMEIALVRIDENRIPIDGKFPDTTSFHSNEFGTDNPLEYGLGKTCEISALSDSPNVYKYGSVTGLTKGKVRVQCASVRTSTLWTNTVEFEITLHDQIEIESVDDHPFGETGDSGSLVLQKDSNNLTAVGIFEGKIGNIYMVTPIADIKLALCELLSLHRDPPNEIEMETEDSNSSMAIQLYYVPTDSDASQTNTAERNISEEIAKQTTKMQTNILHRTDHKFNSVKAELTAVKVHIDSAKNDTNQKMDQMENRLSGGISNLEALIQQLINRQAQGHT